ncbi:hypothetical protein ACIQ6R_06295 [Streptomyces sp. NPDC096048]|uniref:hypothetical protein n=1 Tax=Streptomyces sp. NPDC096048 TaxID=3366072 RepID=UPI0038255AAA
MKRYDHVSSTEIKAEVQRLREEINRPEMSDATREAAHYGIDQGLDELERRGDL